MEKIKILVASGKWSGSYWESMMKLSGGDGNIYVLGHTDTGILNMVD